jgi:hypothetical protein
MTQSQPPIDLAVIVERYDQFALDWVAYPVQSGESEAEHRERLRDAMDSDAVACAQDVPALLAEIRRLQAMLHPAVQPRSEKRGDVTWLPVWLRILSCPDHGELGQWPVVPYGNKTEAELAWDQHIVEEHSQSAGRIAPGGGWDNHEYVTDKCTCDAYSQCGYCSGGNTRFQWGRA